MKQSLAKVFFGVWVTLILTGCGAGEDIQPTASDEEAEIAAEETKKTDTETDATASSSESEPARTDSASTTPEETETDEEPTTAKSRDGESANTAVEGDLEVHYLDVGQADATLLEYEADGEDYRLLIDAGDWNRNDVVNYLNANNIDQIDVLIGTHVHADHIGQMDKVLNAVEVDEVWMTGNTATSQVFQRALTAIEEHGVAYHEPRAGEIFDIGPLTLEMLHPTQLKGDANKNSLSFKLTYGDVSFLFTGDAEVQEEQAMMASGQNLDADFLQLGHHGSKTSTDAEFLKTVSPEVAIYSAGKDNSYGHPHDEVVSRVLDAGIELYGTPEHGTVIVKTDGNTYSIATQKDGTITPDSSGPENDEAESAPETNQAASEPTPSEGCVDINTASLEDLQRIVHIGPARAEALIEERPFTSVEDLSKIKGIGDGRLTDIQNENIACTGG